jgi:hypothetical protein
VTTRTQDLVAEPAVDPALQQLFADTGSAPQLDDPDFTKEVMAGVDRRKRHVIVRRVLLGLALALIAIPLEDAALVLTQWLVLSLVKIDSGLLADLLAPINSVGSLLSMVLLALRVGYKRLFH